MYAKSHASRSSPSRGVVFCDLANILGDIIDDATLIYYQQPMRVVKQYHALKELLKNTCG